MTGSARLVVYLLFGLVLLGLATLHGAVLVLALPVLVYLAAAILAAPGELHLATTRTVSKEVVAPGQRVDVEVCVTNEGDALEELHLLEKIPTGLRVVQGDIRKVLAFDSGKTSEIEYTVTGDRRGRYLVGELRARASDPFGLFQVEAACPDPVELLVVPGAVRLKRVNIRPGQTRGFAGPIPARQGGSGMDFFGVREFQTGDSLRRINWKTSARHPQATFSNEFEQERIADVGLILDARQRTDVATREGRLFEAAVLATSSLAEAFLEDGHRVGLLIFGHLLQRVFPGYGKVQQERILRTLAKAETGVNYALEDLGNLPTRLFPAHSQVVMVSSLAVEDTSRLIRLRSRGYSLLIVSPDPVDFEARALAGGRANEYAARIARIERGLMLRKLRRAGIQVVSWQVDQPLDRVLSTSLGRHWVFHQGLRRRL